MVAGAPCSSTGLVLSTMNQVAVHFFLIELRHDLTVSGGGSAMAGGLVAAPGGAWGVAIAKGVSAYALAGGKEDLKEKTSKSTLTLLRVPCF